MILSWPKLAHMTTRWGTILDSIIQGFAQRMENWVLEITAEFTHAHWNDLVAVRIVLRHQAFQDITPVHD